MAPNVLPWPDAAPPPEPPPPPPDAIALMRTMLPHATPTALLHDAMGILHDAPGPALAMLHDLNRFDLELAGHIPRVDWDSLQIVESHDEEGRMELLSEDQIYVLLGLRDEETGKVPASNDPRTVEENVDNDGAAVPVSDAIPSEFVISYDKNHPKMDLGTMYPSMKEFKMAVRQFAINEEFALGTEKSDKKRYKEELVDGKEEVIQAWYMDDSEEDQRLPHHREPKEFIPLDKLSELGILSWCLNADDWENDGNLKKIREARGYSYMDICDVCPEKLPNYEAKLKNFFEEHLHTDEEIRYCLEGSGYFDVRDQKDQWIRIAVKKGGMIVLPAGMYHRFTLDSDNYIKAMRLFVGEPVWTPYNRPQDHLPARKEYVDRIINRGGNQAVEAR